jgi:leukotriene-A4 hydrolase
LISLFKRNFQIKIRVYGSAQITGTVITESETKLILDTRNLDIKLVSDPKGNFLNFNINDQPENPLGSPLIINLGRTYLKGETVSVIVYYKTIPNQSSGALQWLTPDQTLGKQYPFVYTQCEAIQCRTLLPCQDSPGAKVYVTARLTVPKPLTALLAGVQSAEPQINGDTQTFTYKSPNPIPSYLIAFAAGALEYRSLGKRTGVFAEKEIVEKAQYEFEDTEQYVSTVKYI